jgi:outer membrane scaffolding protein for murein synthesis (MipA/OmpV family)
VSALLCSAAFAARADQPLWELGLGAGALHLPHYRGSDQSRNWLLPIPYFIYRGEVFRADREGAHAVFVDGERLDLDISLAANTPTRSKDNRARAGLADLAPTVEVGPSAKLLLTGGVGWKLDLRLPARAVITVERSPQVIGWTVSPVLNLDLRASGWDLAFNAGPVAASRKYNAYFYDVPAAQATAARPAYAARGGAGGWAFTTTASRRFGDFWVGSYVQYDSLAGAVFADSPLVRKRQNLAYGIGLSYVFKVSEARAPERR